jgi:hypothetical protein
MRPAPVAAATLTVAAAVAAALAVSSAASGTSVEPSGVTGYHGWCNNSTSGVYIVLEGTGQPPKLVTSTATLNPVSVVALHGGEHLAYYRLPGRALPRALSAVTPQGTLAHVFYAACITRPPSTA